MAIELCLIGVLNVWTDKPAVAWSQAILTLVWTFTFQLSAGQLGAFPYLTTNLKKKKKQIITLGFGYRMGSSCGNWINSSSTKDYLSRT